MNSPERLSRTSKKSVHSKLNDYYTSPLQATERKTRNAMSPQVGVISVHELREIRDKTLQGLQKDSIIMPQQELDAIKQRFVIKTKEDIQQEKIEKAT